MEQPAPEILDQLRHVAEAPGERALRAREAASLIRAACGHRWVGLYDVKADEISILAFDGPDPPAHPTFPRTSGLNGVAVEAANSVVVQDVSRDPRYLVTFAATGSEMIVPVKIEDQGVVGTIDVESDRVNAFNERDQYFIEACARALVGLWSRTR